MLEELNAFSAVQHDDDNNDLPALTGNETTLEVLDYMVIVITRLLTANKAFKGGYMLNKLLGEHSRMTHDIDFSVASVEVYEEVKSILKIIAEKFSEQGIISTYEIKETISPTSSGGIKFYDENGVQFLGVDVGMHDIAYGIQHYDFDVVSVEGFEIERMLSDKLIAILSRKRFRRTKDLYDFYAITSMFDFDYRKLVRFIEYRGGAEWDNIPFNETVITQYNKAWDKLDVISALTGDTLSKPEFQIAIERFYKVALAIKARERRALWDHNLQILR